jgi:hypothetical protein
MADLELRPAGLQLLNEAVGWPDAVGIHQRRLGLARSLGDREECFDLLRDGGAAGRMQVKSTRTDTNDDTFGHAIDRGSFP